VTETWKSIPGHSGYEVSDKGRVRSIDREVVRTFASGDYSSIRPGRVLKPGLARNGYLSVVLGRSVGTKFVHHLVALTFIGPREAATEVCHVNGVKTDNRPENLYYGSRSQNNVDITKHGGKRKITVEQVREIRSRYLGTWDHANQLADEFGVSAKHIYNIGTRRRYYEHVE